MDRIVTFVQPFLFSIKLNKKLCLKCVRSCEGLINKSDVHSATEDVSRDGESILGQMMRKPVTPSPEKSSKNNQSPENVAPLTIPGRFDETPDKDPEYLLA